VQGEHGDEGPQLRAGDGDRPPVVVVHFEFAEEPDAHAFDGTVRRERRWRRAAQSAANRSATRCSWSYRLRAGDR
jgi:hypothetical protein